MILSRTRRGVYEDLVDDLVEKIGKGVLTRGDFLLPERELASHYGISYMSVRKGLDELVMRELIRKLPGKGNVVLGLPPQVRRVAVLLPNMRSGFIQNIVGGVGRNHAKEGIIAHYFESRDQETDELSRLDHLESEGFAGALIYSLSTPACHVKIREISRHLPVVLLDRSVPGADAPVVASDNMAGARLLTSHVLDEGYGNPAIVLPHYLSTSTTHDRLEGFRQVLAERNGGARPELECLGRFTLAEEEAAEQWVRREIRRIMATAPPPNAILFEHDLVALYGMNELKKLGKRVPDDVGVTGFDDLPFAAHVSPSLTTVRQFGDALGERAMDILCGILDGNGGKTAPVVRMAVELIKRDSTRRIGAGE